MISQELQQKAGEKGSHHGEYCGSDRHQFTPETTAQTQSRKQHLKWQLTSIVNRTLQAIQTHRCCWYGEDNLYRIVTTSIDEVCLSEEYQDHDGYFSDHTCRKLDQLFQLKGFQLLERPLYQCGTEGVGGPDWIENIVLRVM